MNIENKIYVNDFEEISNLNIAYNKLNGKTILITGSTGLIGSCLVDYLMYRNNVLNDNIKVICSVRNKEESIKRFSKYIESKKFIIVEQDILEEINIEYDADYVIHAASGADPKTYVTNPVGVMKTNFIGTLNLLNYAKKSKAKRMMFVSSGEVYGQTLDKEAKFKEYENGNVEFLNSRSCYPESKRASETLCMAYSAQFDIETVIGRFCHVYGPTMLKKDSRVYAQMLNNVLEDNDIVLKSEGLQIRSYCYVVDAVSAILCILLNGEKNNAYNVSDKESIVTIRTLAETIAKVSNKKVKFELPSETDKKGYTKLTQTIMDSEKLENIGWHPITKFEDGIKKTINILKS